MTVFGVFVYNDFTDMGDDEWIGAGKYGEPKKVVSRKINVSDGRLLPVDLPAIYKLPILKNSNLAV